MAMFDCAHCGDSHHVNDFCATGPMSAGPVAPTPRETADHAELLRLAEAAKNGEWWSDDDVISHQGVSREDERFIYAFTPAVCSALLSEIAALRGERDRLHAEADENGLLAYRLTQAERQRDEAVGLLRELIEPYATLDDVQLFRILTNGHATRITSARAFLANQGAE